MDFLGIASKSHQTVPSSKTVLAAVASFTASAILIRSIANELIPYQIRDSIFSRLRDLSNRLLSYQLTIVIEEFDGLSINQIFEAAHTYLGTKIAQSTRRLKLSQPEKEKNFTVSMDRNEEMVDLFEGVQLKWVFVCTQVQSSSTFNNNNNDLNSNLRSEIRTFELSFHKKYKEKVLGSYVPYILQQSKAIKEERKVGKLYTIDYNSVGYWGAVNLDHPATFDTLAMDPVLKKIVTDDLERFVKRKDFYKSVGKAWKRGYLLYGPPGTGKSSLVAAMANYLNFNIYDLDLTDVNCNSDLRRILIGTANRSIIVIEDIDCNIDLQDRAENAPSLHRNPYDNKVTLSGVLNFIDGLWSSCGDERIIVFTTNHKEKLDPALLRPGRMDMHIHMSYCTPSGFKILAYKYLKISDHLLFEEIEGLIETTEVTPAEVAGELMKQEDVEISLQEFIKFLKTKKMDLDAGKAPKNDTKTEGQEGKEQHETV